MTWVVLGRGTGAGRDEIMAAPDVADRWRFGSITTVNDAVELHPA